MYLVDDHRVSLIICVNNSIPHSIKVCKSYLYGMFQGSALPQRWVFAVIMCLGSMTLFTMRICLSLAITAMVSTTQVTNGTNSEGVILPEADSTSSRSSSGRTHEWDEYTQVSYPKYDVIPKCFDRHVAQLVFSRIHPLTL